MCNTISHFHPSLLSEVKSFPLRYSTYPGLLVNVRLVWGVIKSFIAQAPAINQQVGPVRDRRQHECIRGATTLSIMALDIMTFGIMTLGIMTHSKMKIGIMTLVITTFGKVTLIKMTLSTMTLSIMAYGITALSITIKNSTLSITLWPLRSVPN